MVSWTRDGEVSNHWRATSGLVNPIYLASNGTVDTNWPTRLHYNKPMAYIYDPQPADETFDYLRATARFTFTDAEAADLTDSQRLTASMFVVAASEFAPGQVPTPNQIRSVGTSNMVGVYRSTNSTRVGAAVPFGIKGPRAADLTPGEKYWVMVFPSEVIWGSTPSAVNDVVVGFVSASRVVSITANHSPVKPTIVSPGAAVVQAPGTTFNLTFDSSADLDYDASPGGVDSSWNIVGVQVQKAAVPVDPATPLVWTDVQTRSTYKNPTLGPNPITFDLPAWYITSSTNNYYTHDYPPDGPYALQPSGMLDLLVSGTVRVMAAPQASDAVPFTKASKFSAGALILPGGDWYVRMRTFDPGGEGGTFPLNYTDGNYTPTSYATKSPYNTSPWSDAVRVIIPSQVPAPVPLSPRDGIALTKGSTIPLTYQYRNTYSPPKPQQSRLVQLRKVGATAWITIANDTTSSTTTSVASGLLEAGFEYQWRVQVTDTSGVVSAFSETVSFWVVPVPATGDIRPVPSNTIDGATLGCGTYRAFVYKRGGKVRVGEITNISGLDWSRVRDDISDAQIVVSGWDLDCGNLLSKLQTWAYELVLFRYTVFGVERVWEGPLTLLTYERDKVTIQAKDVMAYPYRRIIKQAMNDTGKEPTAGRTVVARAVQVLQNALAIDDPNVLAYLQVLAHPDDAKQYRSLPAYSRTAFEEVDDMAANAGLDYTAVGRSILLWSTKHRIGTLPEFRDEDLGSPPIVSEYGMSMATDYSVSDGNGVHGDATRRPEVSPGVYGPDPVYGVVEMLSSTWASETPTDTGTYTQEGLETLKASFAKYAERSIADRYPPPVVVRVPDNTTLNPSTVLSIQQLVPGVVIPLRSTGTLRSVVANQKLDSLKVTVTDGVENIAITMSPFNQDDATLEEETP